LPPDDVSFVFEKVVPLIRAKSKVPPRLPRFLPVVTPSSPVYAVAQTVTESEYDVLLAVALPCEGQNHCLYGSVRGSTSPPETGDTLPEAILLKGEIKAQFIKSECYAYCNQAYIQWKEGDYYYSVGLKAGAKADLLKVANSALPTK